MNEAGVGSNPATKMRNIRMKPKETIRQDLKTLVEGEIYLRQIAENLEQVFWVQEIQSGRILYISPAFETVWGRSRVSFYSNPQLFIESVHPEDRLQVLVARPHDDRKLVNQEYRIMRPDGSLRWILVRTFLIQEEDGESYYQVSIAQDITDQKNVELSLHKTLDLSRELFNLSRKMSLARSPEVVVKALMSSSELRSAQRAAVLFFKSPDVGPASGVELTTFWQSSQIPPLWLDESTLYEETALWELLQSSKPVVFADIQSDSRLADSARDFLQEQGIKTLAIFPMVALGAWLGCLFVFYHQEQNFNKSDLRHIKVLVDQVTITLYNLRLLTVEEESRHEAEQANALKTRFLAMVSHELRTPLTSIIGFTATLLAEDVSWEQDEQRDFIRTIQQEANRLQELINHLLDLSRLEAGMLPISLKSLPLNEILRDVMPQLNAMTNGHKISFHLPADLPPVQVDAKRIAQVLVNLVHNAISYSPERTEITISAKIRGKYVQVNVTDQGPGILPADRKWVFEAFRRGSKEEGDPTKGAGLGLAICKGLIEAHGGRIWIKEKTTPGATISFTIPMAPVIPEEQDQ
jgi:PAS domain S-box-containing protein